MRPRKHDRQLPACLYHKHGRYWRVKRGKWHNLRSDDEKALREYAQRQQQENPATGTMPERIDRVLQVHLKGLGKSPQVQYRHCAGMGIG